VLARRLLILAAVLMGLIALAAGVAPREPARDTTASPTPIQGASPPMATVERTLDAQSSDQEVAARVGQTVIIIVETDELDSVSLGDYGIETADPESPARFELLADVPGSYPIHLLQADRTIGTLEVRPAAG
jgi:hypothetical protein